MFAKVLVVDDSLVDRRLVGGILEQDPFLRVDYAESGTEALQRMQQSPAKLVLTDLVMPNMDGLELVRQLRTQNPAVPVVLMTGKGNGSVAVQALREGAAGYIPKTQLKERLRGTVSLLLGTLSEAFDPARLAECMRHVEYRLRFGNQPGYIYRVVGLAHQAATSANLCDWRRRLHLAAALEQALHNAIYRGNLEIEGGPGKRSADVEQLVRERREQLPYRKRHVTVTIRVEPQIATLTVRDEGPGFDTSWGTEQFQGPDLEEHDRHGLLLMHALMDEVRFNETGNEVVLIMRDHAADA